MSFLSNVGLWCLLQFGIEHIPQKCIYFFKRYSFCTYSNLATKPHFGQICTKHVVLANLKMWHRFCSSSWPSLIVQIISHTLSFRLSHETWFYLHKLIYYRPSSYSESMVILQKYSILGFHKKCKVLDSLSPKLFF